MPTARCKTINILDNLWLTVIADNLGLAGYMSDELSYDTVIMNAIFLNTQNC